MPMTRSTTSEARPTTTRHPKSVGSRRGNVEKRRRHLSVRSHYLNVRNKAVAGQYLLNNLVSEINKLIESEFLS
jgi:hypothetical protein